MIQGICLLEYERPMVDCVFVYEKCCLKVTKYTQNSVDANLSFTWGNQVSVCVGKQKVDVS